MEPKHRPVDVIEADLGTTLIEIGRKTVQKDTLAQQIAGLEVTARTLDAELMAARVAAQQVAAPATP